MISKKLGKKGFTYLIVSSLMVVVLISAFFAISQYKHMDAYDRYSIRIRTMNDFVTNFENDVHRASATAAFRAMIALEDDVTKKGRFLSDIDIVFKDAFYNGTINGTISAVMQNSTMKDYIAKTQLIANKIGMNLYFNVTRIELSQSDPWSIDVTVFATLNLSDVNNMAYWYKDEEFVTNVPIYNLRDPVYGVGTHNKIPNTIRTFNDTLVVPVNDVSNLNMHINDSYYIASPAAPGFLMRFEGKLGPDVNGIESIVYLPTLSQVLTVYPERVKVDYLYFNNTPLSDDILCNVTGVLSNSYFIIPLDRQDLYQVRNVPHLNNTDCLP